MGGCATSKEQRFQHYLENEILEGIYPEPSARNIKSKSRIPTKLLNNEDEENTQDPEDTEETKSNTKKSPKGNTTAPDSRMRVTETNEWPYSVHGVVSVQFPGAPSSTWGTGTLIGPNIVLTAGHLLYSHQYKAYADPQSMQFLPGINGQVLPFGVASIERYFVSRSYVNEEREDYGILILTEPIGRMTGYFGLDCSKPEEITKKKLYRTGYSSGDTAEQEANNYELWEMEDSISSTEKAKGEMQSVIWYQDGRDCYVCGVQGLGNERLLLAKSHYEQIYSWIKQSGVKEHLGLPGKKKELLLNGYEIKLNAKSVPLLLKYDLDNMKTLNLSFQDMSKVGAKILAQNTSWVNLMELTLTSCNIDSEGALALAQNTSWTKIHVLNLRMNKIDAQGARALAQSTSWSNLVSFDLSFNNIGAEGARFLAQNTSWPQLRLLYLSENRIGDEGVTALAENTSWIHLGYLALSKNRIGVEGAKGLALNTSWTELAKLLLSENKINVKAAKELAKNTSWVNLKEVDLERNDVGIEGIRALERNWENCHFSYL